MVFVFEQKPSGDEMDETWKSSSLNSISQFVHINFWVNQVHWTQIVKNEISLKHWLTYNIVWVLQLFLKKNPGLVGKIATRGFLHPYQCSNLIYKIQDDYKAILVTTPMHLTQRYSLDAINTNVIPLLFYVDDMIIVGSDLQGIQQLSSYINI